MLKQEVTFTDFDGSERTRTFYFHMTEVEMVKALVSEDGGLENRFKNALDSDDKTRFILVFDELVRLSIGKRDDDFGFTKPKGYADMFMASEAYSQMFKDMMSEAKFAVAFFNGIFPKKVLEKAKTDLLQRQGEPGVPTVDKEALSLFDLDEKAPANEEPKAKKPGQDYTVAELEMMSNREFAEWEKDTPPRIMRQEQLQYAYARRAKA